ncbi:ATP-binding protein [Methylophaga sp.]|uniref:ATP-binding protein n=1 Tax=Methylophaga sp. TaxID=2024840 RepID=UPI003F6A05F5
MDHDSLMPHGVCFNWNLELLFLHVASDLLIALAYSSIPITIVYFASKRRSSGLATYYYLFAAFILACGVTHMLGIITLWSPIYLVSGTAKALTAIVSVVTAVYLIPRVPLLMELPDIDELTEINSELKKENQNRLRSEKLLIDKQNQLDETNARLIALIDSIPSAVCWLDSAGRFTGANAEYKNLFGFPVQEDSDDNAFVPCFSDRDEIISSLSSLQNGETDLLKYEKETVSLKGEIVIDVSMVLIRDEDSMHRGFLVVINDVTARKKMESARDKAISEAEQASAVKTQFLARVSHELRTPINSILGFTELLKIKNLVTSKGREYLQHINDSGHYLLDLVNDVLDLAKIESGTLDMKFEPVSLDEVIKASISMHSNYAIEREVEIHYQSSSDAYFIIGDKVRLLEVINNILTNSIKYKANDSKTHDVRIFLDRPTASHIELTLRDNGVGMEINNQNDPFELFNRLNQNGNNEGVGLGLSICKRLVELMGAEIGLESQVGVGTTVKIKFNAYFKNSK